MRDSGHGGGGPSDEYVGFCPTWYARAMWGRLTTRRSGSVERRLEATLAPASAHLGVSRLSTTIRTMARGALLVVSGYSRQRDCGTICHLDTDWIVPPCGRIVPALDAPAAAPVHRRHDGHAINERLARLLDYLLEEVRVLREVFTETTGRKRIPFTDDQRRRLAIKGKGLIPDERETCCQLFAHRRSWTGFASSPPSGTTAPLIAGSLAGPASPVMSASS